MATEADVAALYTSVLGRAPDAGGLAYFADLVSKGTPLSQVREALASSPEAQVRSLYSDVLGRQADLPGQKYFADLAIAGTPIADIRKSIAYSPESQGLLENIYTTDLKRKSDAGGKQYYTDFLAGGGLLSDVQSNVRGSEEAQKLLAKTDTTTTTTTGLTAAQLEAKKIADALLAKQAADALLAKQAADALLAKNGKTGTTTDYSAYRGQLNPLYQQAFGRDIDASGLAYYGKMLAEGTPISTILASLRASDEFKTPAVQTFQKGIRTVPFGSQVVDGRVQQMAQYAQPAVQAGQAMGSPSLQGFLAGRQGQVSGGDINSLYRNVLGRAPDPGGVDYYNAKMKGGATLGDVEAEMRGSAEFKQPLAQFQQQMQYQTALPGMVQPFNPADIPKTFQQVISPGPRLDINQTVIPGWLQTAISAQKVKDGIEVTDQDKFNAANTKTTYSGLGQNTANTNTGTTGANTGGLLAASQISPQIISGYTDYLGRAPGSIDLTGASYWQNLLNKGTPIADIYSGLAGSAEGLLYAPTRQSKLAAAASAAANAGGGGSEH